MFINLVEGKLTLNSHRNPEAQATDLEDMLSAIESQTGETLVISADGVKNALEDGEFLGTIKATQEAVEDLHGALC